MAVSGWRDLLNTIRTNLITATGLTGNQVFVDLPTQGAISQLTQSGTPALISIMDLQMARDTTRWGMQRSPAVAVTPGVSVTPNSLLALNGAAGVLSFVVAQVTPPNWVAGDSIGVTVFRGSRSTDVTYNILPTDTPTIVAQQLVALINASAPLNTWVTASDPGSNATFQLVLANPSTLPGVMVVVTAGNGGYYISEVARQERCIQIAVWTKTEVNRETYGGLVRAWIAQTQYAFGVQLPDGSWARVKYNSDSVGRDNHFADIYRWSFLADCDMSVLIQENLYSVLGINSTLTGG